MEQLSKGFIDIHSHLLPVQDGPKDMGQAIQAFRIAGENNISDIILTPHYYSGDRGYDQRQILDTFEYLKTEIERNGLKIKVYLGNECVVDECLSGDLHTGKALTLNNSKYVLCEYPLFQVPCNYNTMIYRLMDKGYKPVIAHPERNTFFDNYHESIQELKENGCMIQLNTGSILMQYRGKCRRNAIMLLKDKMVDFIATDAHSHITRSPKSQADAYRKLRRHFNLEYLLDLFEKNPGNMIY